MKIRRGRKRTNYYFTDLHEKKIIEYNENKDNLKIKSEIYSQWIRPAFDEMVNKIVYTYKFTNLSNIDDLKQECKVWLITILDKFDPSKGSKAFSYFSVVTKNWFIHKVKKQSKQLKTELVHEDCINNTNYENLITENNYHSLREEKEFWILLSKNLKHWENIEEKINDKKVLQAIQIVLESKEDIEIFNKKAIYLYLREITGLNTKQVVSSLNRIRAKYFDFKDDWDTGDI